MMSDNKIEWDDSEDPVLPEMVPSEADIVEVTISPGGKETATIFSKRQRVVDLHHFDSDGVFVRTERDKKIMPGMGCPGNSTLIPPPTFNGSQAAVFDVEKQEWRLDECHKGLEVFCKKTGEQCKVDWVGTIPDQYTTQRPTTPADKWVDDAWQTDLPTLKKQARADIKAAAEMASKRGLASAVLTSCEASMLNSLYHQWQIVDNADDQMIPEIFGVYDPNAKPVEAVKTVLYMLDEHDSVGKAIFEVSASAQLKIDNYDDPIKIQNARLLALETLSKLFREG